DLGRAGRAETGAEARAATRRAMSELRHGARRTLVPGLRAVVGRLPPLAREAGGRGGRRRVRAGQPHLAHAARPRPSPGTADAPLPRRPPRGADPAVPPLP